MTTECKPGQRIIDLGDREPADGYGLVARVFADLAPGDAFVVVADRDLDHLVGTFSLVWGEEFVAARLASDKRPSSYLINRRALPAPQP
jgi:hypothetical protein